MDTSITAITSTRDRPSATAASASSRRVRLSELLPDVRELRTLVREVTEMVDHLLEESKPAH